MDVQIFESPTSRRQNFNTKQIAEIHLATDNFKTPNPLSRGLGVFSRLITYYSTMIVLVAVSVLPDSVVTVT